MRNDPSASADLIRAHTRPARPPLVPEVALLVADDVVALWEALEERRGAPGEEPPFWAAAWPGGQVLARHVLDAPEVVAGRPVLDLGSGSGLVAVATALVGAGPVVASEIDAFGRAAIALNAQLNAVPGVRIVGDVLGDRAPDGGVVLAGDVCYDRAMTERVLPFLEDARAHGCEVLLGDPGRPYLPVDRLQPVAEFDVADAAGGPARRTTVWRLP